LYSHMGMECMDNMQMVLSLTSSKKQEVGTDRSCLEEHKGSSFMVVYRIDIHWEEDMDKSFMVLLDMLNSHMCLVGMDNRHLGVGQKCCNHWEVDKDRNCLVQHTNNIPLVGYMISMH
jgi:hypothetical protein